MSDQQAQRVRDGVRRDRGAVRGAPAGDAFAVRRLPLFAGSTRLVRRALERVSLRSPATRQRRRSNANGQRSDDVGRRRHARLIRPRRAAALADQPDHSKRRPARARRRPGPHPIAHVDRPGARAAARRLPDRQRPAAGMGLYCLARSRSRSGRNPLGIGPRTRGRGGEPGGRVAEG